VNVDEYEVGVSHNGATHVGVSSLFRRKKPFLPSNGTADDGDELQPQPPLYIIGREELSQCSSLDLETQQRTPRMDLLFSVEQVRFVCHCFAHALTLTLIRALTIILSLPLHTPPHCCLVRM